jgi:protein gp37
VRRSSISWTDFSGGDLNFVIGCTPASEGCEHCYARALIEERGGRDFSRVTVYPRKLAALARADFRTDGVPFRRGPGSRPLAFAVDLGDLLHPEVPEAFVRQAFAVMAGRSDVDFQVLTKRPRPLPFPVPGNVWLGVSVENERHLDRLEVLRGIPAAVRFVSFEPLLGPVRPDLAGISWVIVGGESGEGRRAFDKRWALELRDQCAASGVAFFFKQGSGLWPGADDLLDGVKCKAFPA